MTIEDKATPDLVFALLARVSIVRRHPFSTGWRAMPFVIVERLTRGHYRIDIEDGQTYVVGPGEAFVIPANVRHRLSVTSQGRSRGVPEAMVHWAHVQWLAHGYLDPLGDLSGALLFNARDGGRVGKALEQFPRSDSPPTAAESGIRASARTQEAGFRLLGLLLDLAGVDRVETDDEDLRRIRPALDLIRTNLASKLTRASLARAAYLSPTRFHYVFARATGQAPMAYVRRLRIERASQMLIHSDLAVSDIASRVGFGDQYHFSRVFRRETGEAPSSYRRRVRDAAG
ncbi:MAG: helix-turn-helix domain-containing protein [Chitinivibrionales bacterium]|nr:helix-turn-helix domain-containing protein [Chitinivibrionales bacterium]